MTTQQIADRLVELSRKGESEQAYRELFADDAVAYEMEGIPEDQRVTRGKDALLAKNANYGKDIQQMHDSSVSDPLVAGNFFSCHMMIDITKKDQGRTKMEELCLYEVKDGKIASERFFYQM